MNFAEQAAEFSCSVKFDQLPSLTVQQAGICFLDWLCVAVTGAKTSSVGEVVTKWLTKENYPGPSTVLGYDLKVNEMQAALANGAFGHVLDYDDIYPWGPGHPSSTIMPGVLALAEKYGLSGKEVIEAIVVGFQVQFASGEAIMLEHYNLGWHNTGTLGHIGAAAAAAKMMKLDQEATCNAIGIAATSAGGLQSVFGSMSKSYNAGKAAMDGVLAATMASYGYDSTANVFERNGGFWRVLASKYDAQKSLQALKDNYVVDGVRFKFYPSCYSTHTIIECMKDIRKQIGDKFDPQNISKLSYTVHPRCLNVAAIPEPKDGLEGKFSVQFCGAHTLLNGDISLDDFTDQAVNDPACKRLMNMISLEVNPEYEEDRIAIAVVEMSDGAKYTTSLNLAELTKDVKIANQGVKEKFRDIMKNYPQTVKLLEKDLSTIGDMRVVMNTLRAES